MTGLRLGSRLWWGLIVLIAGLWAGGLLSLPVIPGLPSVPTLTLVLLPITHYARDIIAAVATGAGVVVLLAPNANAARWLRGWSLAWIAVLVPLIVLTVSDAEALTEPDALSATAAFLTGTLIGQVTIAQVLAVGAVLALSWAGGWSRWIVAALLVLAAAAPALVGHGGLASSHVAATVSLALHLAAASVWMGGLAVVVGVVAVTAASGALLLGRFSVVALWCVIIVGESGLLSASLRLGSPGQFTGTLYGSFVLAKAVALGFLIRWGWLQRSRVVARFTEDAGAGRLLAVYAGWEALLMGAAVAAGVLLARLGPPDPAAPASGFTVVSLPVVALAVPLLVVTMTRRRPAWVGRLGGYPEAAAIGLVIVVASVGVVGVLSALLGEQVGVIAAAIILIGAGWAWMAASVNDHSIVDVAIVMAAWPVVSWFVARSDAGSTSDWQLLVVSVVAVEALLVMIARGRRRSPAIAPVSVAG